MEGTRNPVAKKRKHSFSVRAMSSVIPQQMRKKRNVLPCVSSFPSTCRRGYLWRLSGRRVLATTSWKTKYFVLHEDRLYYYASMKGQAGGVIDLKSFVDCVEAPLSDNKKANNVFFLVAEERGFFDQGRYYLSAETLSEMKSWVSAIRTVLEKLKRQEPIKASNDYEVNNQDSQYSSVLEDSIHRSNSTTTLYSNTNDQKSLKHLNMKSWHKRSMDCGPLLGLGGEEHDLTYSYSSEEEGLNTSLPVNFVQKSPRSADTSLRRQAMKRGSHFISLDERSNSDTHRSPTYLSFEDLLYPDTGNYGLASGNMKPEKKHIDDIAVVSTDYIRLQSMAKDMKTQADSLTKMDMLGDRLDILHSVMIRLETQASDLMQEISTASYYTKQCVKEAEKSKEDYLDLKEKTERILFQLQNETAAPKYSTITNPRTSDPAESKVQTVYGTDWAQTFPKQHKMTPMNLYQPQSILRSSNGSDNSLTRRNKIQQATVKICQDPAHVNQSLKPPTEIHVQDNLKDEIYTKPNFSEPYKIETENYKCLRRRSLMNYGYMKQSQETQNYRNSRLVEEEPSEKEESKST
eukprot:TRINITY_DN10589_c0_g1_i1.p1 TRINITY_DN10589_c0_g1~~TRINITY_DN10589_c0_g1_i1.p1  ORF type:complete len:574 (-),score=101.45 TRINITY_DN10589_c0_g1_i1:167-1888(-)